jgi:hypothetical protein
MQIDRDIGNMVLLMRHSALPCAFIPGAEQLDFKPTSTIAENTTALVDSSRPLILCDVRLTGPIDVP